MEKFSVLVTARSFGNSDDKAMQLLKSNKCNVEKLENDPKIIEAQLSERISTADAVIAGLEKYSKELIDNAPNLKVISRYGVGYDNVDMEAANANNVIVTNTPGANNDSVSDMAMALMLSVSRHVSLMDKQLKNKNQVRPTGIEMFGKTVGIIGMGRIGKGVAKRCSGFSMRILCLDTYEDEIFAKEYNVEYVDFDTILKEADFITIHVPLVEETRNMFSTSEFRRMKNRTILINTARAGIIDEEALYKALSDNEIAGAGAGLDELMFEPSYDSPLTTLDNCILAPHAGAATYEASSRMSLLAAENVIDVLIKGHCRYSINEL